jgi:hypothetical protein
MVFYKEPPKGEEKTATTSDESSATDIGFVNNGYTASEKEKDAQNGSVVTNGTLDRNGISESTYM